VDAKAIRDVETAWVQSYTTKDVDKIALNYADDASIFMPDAPVITGLPAIKAALKSMVADKNFSLTFSADKVEVSKAGDLAYSQGAYTATMTNLKTKKVSRKQASSSRSIKSSPSAPGRRLPISLTRMLRRRPRSTAPAPRRHRTNTTNPPRENGKSTVFSP